MRIAIVAAGLALFVLLPFIVWGDWFDLILDGDAAVAWLQSYGHGAGIIAVGLLAADVFLPLPASSVMAALGIIYGPVAGGLFAAAGSAASGAAAYFICRVLGRPAVQNLLGKESLKLDWQRFQSGGAAAVAASRALPVLAEVTTGLAGFYKMPLRHFLVALTLGAAVTGFGFAWLGHLGRSDPALTVLTATVLPPILSFLWLRSVVQVPRMER